MYLLKLKIYTLKKAILINRRPMTELTQNLSLAQARSLIDSYAFDLGHVNAESLLKYWLELYQASWIRLATVEALYLGRYKAISIEQILNVWLRIGSPNPHFTYEFERLICRKLPKHLCNISEETANEAKPPALGLERPKQAETTANILSNGHGQRDMLALSLRDNAVLESQSVAEVSPMSDCGKKAASFYGGVPITSSAEENKQTSPAQKPDEPNFKKTFSHVKDSSKNTIENNLSLISSWGPSYESNWSEFTEGNTTIHQFIPLPDVSSFFNRLKTFGEEQLEGQ